MTPTHTDTAMPVTFEARERLRNQQRQEAVHLEALLAAQRRLVAQREKADRVIARAEQHIAVRQAEVDRAVLALIETSGVTQTALLLGRTKADIARLARVERRRSAATCPIGWGAAISLRPA